MCRKHWRIMAKQRARSRAQKQTGRPPERERVKHSLIRSRGEREGNARALRTERARGREDAIQGQTANGDESREKTATMKTFGEER